MEQVFDVIVCDIGMPDMDGHELLGRIRAHGLNLATPAIALTGYGRKDDAARVTDSGFGLHLNKPVSLDALIAAVKRLAKV
jgi:two-component system CheB/CheR fusion protein